ncbi:hypothetical protein [Dictyobacter kobayashii]|uniref:Helicase C-terminal domain-containing protein n=1 Tax=Dictyobacter kobayashii TaxID=2014872 RepID=A0A402AZI8_9CHLR|nr:hypothetical protein [Dictyobacter kobayashii]GCE24512.1 hypothetical protein KDK_83120 [Dictyobacter kobayashii]
MLYIDQNQERSTARRLEWVLQQAGVKSWTLPNTVKPEDRQQRIIEAMSMASEGGAPVSVAIVPYSRVNEGINLQSVVDTIIWVEMALNLFMLEQASRRAWRLGKREEVRIYYLAYAGTVGHQKMRKLGAQSGPLLHSPENQPEEPSLKKPALTRPRLPASPQLLRQNSSLTRMHPPHRSSPYSATMMPAN